ncbi:MAG: hypothetical protein ACYCU7_11490 [Acidimicrobiales bacterium]
MTLAVSSAAATGPVRLTGAFSELGAWAARRRSALLALLAVVVTGFAYSIWWLPLVRHANAWLTPGDLWGTYRAAHTVGWGALGDVYSSGTGLVAFPGIAVLLAPVAMLTGALGLSESFPYQLSHPTAWLILGPVELLLGAAVLVPLDGLAERLGVDRRRRAALAMIGAVAVWPVIAMWGHPEDTLAMGFGAAAVSAAVSAKWRSCAWLLGGALALQPLVLLMAPVVLALAPTWRSLLKASVRALVPSALMLVLPLLEQWRSTTHALLDQPNYPALDHPTPWFFLAPVLSPSHVTRGVVRQLVRHGRGWTTLRVSGVHRVGEVVAAGPGRMVALVLAGTFGMWLWRRRDRITPPQLLWAAAVCLALRSVFESVMDPFYLWPPLAVAAVLLAFNGGWRLAAGVTAIAAVTVFSQYHFSPWGWYGPCVGALALILALAYPRLSGRSIPRFDRTATYGLRLALGTRAGGLG